MTDFLATVLARAAVMLLEELFTYLTRAAFILTLERDVHPPGRACCCA